MKVYIDCDVAVKLAQWGLLTRFTQHVKKQGRAEIYTVSTLRYRFKLADRFKAAAMLGSTAAVDQLLTFVGECTAPLGHDSQVAESLADVPSIDAGEAALFSAAANYDAALVDTGDKNSLRALGALGSSHVATNALRGKLACLEQTMLYLVGRWSFDTVKTAVGSYPEADTSVSKCFGGNLEAAARQSLERHVGELQTACSGILAPQPFSWVA